MFLNLMRSNYFYFSGNFFLTGLYPSLQNGNIKGERIRIKDKSNTVGQQMPAIVKTFKWIPARYSNKNIVVPYKLTLIVDIPGD